MTRQTTPEERRVLVRKAKQLLRLYGDYILNNRETAGLLRGLVAIFADLEAAEAENKMLREATEALTDPEGHIWHGGAQECTGECKAIRSALAAIRVRR